MQKDLNHAAISSAIIAVSENIKSENKSLQDLIGFPITGQILFVFSQEEESWQSLIEYLIDFTGPAAVLLSSKRPGPTPDLSKLISQGKVKSGSGVFGPELLVIIGPLKQIVVAGSGVIIVDCAVAQACKNFIEKLISDGEKV